MSKAFLARQKEMENTSSRSVVNDASGINRQHLGNGIDTKDGVTELDGNVVLLQEEGADDGKQPEVQRYPTNPVGIVQR